MSGRSTLVCCQLRATCTRTISHISRQSKAGHKKWCRDPQNHYSCDSNHSTVQYKIQYHHNYHQGFIDQLTALHQSRIAQNREPTQPQPEPYTSLARASGSIKAGPRSGTILLRASFDVLSLFAILPCLLQLRCQCGCDNQVRLVTVHEHAPYAKSEAE
jgi:hypothetical protein